MARGKNVDLAELEPGEQAEVAAVSITGANTVKALVPATDRALGAPRIATFWKVALVLQALLLGALLALGALAFRELIALRSQLNDNRAAAERWATRATALGQQTQGLQDETVNLRQYLSSNAAEDLLFLKIVVLKPNVDLNLARTIARDVHRYSELHGKDPNLVLAIIAEESDFDPRAVSPVGAVGLMQVMPQWKKVLGIAGDLTDPEVSIRYGLQVLSFYTEMYHDLGTALTAYNRGPGPVDNALMHGRNPKNEYPTRVLATYERLKKLSVTTMSK